MVNALFTSGAVARVNTINRTFMHLLNFMRLQSNAIDGMRIQCLAHRQKGLNQLLDATLTQMPKGNTEQLQVPQELNVEKCDRKGGVVITTISVQLPGPDMNTRRWSLE
jgi:hypothetical protein